MLLSFTVKDSLFLRLRLRGKTFRSACGVLPKAGKMKLVFREAKVARIGNVVLGHEREKPEV